MLNGAIFKLPYDVIADFEPVAMIAMGTQLIVGRKSLEANNLKEMIAWLKANPGKATAGRPAPAPARMSPASSSRRRPAPTFQFVPYRGAGPAMIDLVAGQIDIMFDQASNSLPQYKNGAIKAFAVTSPTRLRPRPIFRPSTRRACPASTSPTGTASGHRRTRRRRSSQSSTRPSSPRLPIPRVKQRFAELGQEIPPADQQSPAALGAFQKAETEKWWPIVKAADIKPE